MPLSIPKIDSTDIEKFCKMTYPERAAKVLSIFLEDYTYEELQSFSVKKGTLYDKIPTLEDFLAHFAYRDITFAIELKVDGIEKEVADLIFRYGIDKKTVVTAFEMERIRKTKEYAPLLRVGYLTKNVDEDVIHQLMEFGADEL